MPHGDVDGFQQYPVVEQIVGAPAPQTWEPIVESIQVVPQTRVQNLPPDLIVDVPAPRILDAAVGGVCAAPREHVLNRTPEQIVDEPVPQVAEEIVDAALRSWFPSSSVVPVRG